MELEREEIGVLVADSGAFIKGAPLQKWSSKVVTIREVIAEIRDKATRERLQVLPYELTFKEPSTEALQHVTRFAKKTGDYGSLSPVDLKLMALTYQLHLELEPAAESQLRADPLKQQATVDKGTGYLKTVGFYVPRRDNHKDRDHTRNQSDDGRSQSDGGRGHSDGGSHSEGDNTCDTLHRGEEKNEDLVKKVAELSLDECDKDEDDDSEGWITPENFQQACEEMGGVLDDLPQCLTVGCITTDFAMQNVILQMGLNLISTEGRRIRQLRTYAKKCKGCFKTTTDTGLVWCPWCGNRSLYRVAVVVDSTGKMSYRPLSNKQFSHKGLRYPLPVPKSGRHTHNPVLAPDQQVTYRDRRRRENRMDPLDLDYVAQSSPFAVHDVTSRGARLAMGAGRRGGGEGYRRRNPNAVHPKGQRRK